MQVAGLGVRDVLGVVREARDTAGGSAHVVVTGVLAAELARALRGDGARESGVRVGTVVDGASAVVVVLGGAATAADEALMRDAVRASVPVVAVQTDPRAGMTQPYVPATDVVTCPPGRGFPVDEIAETLARALGRDAVPLAAALPAVRGPVVRDLIRRAGLRAAAIGALPRRTQADFPALALLQARLVLDLAAAHGRTVGRERAPELAAVLGTGLGARALVRRLPSRIPLVGGVAAFLATRALGEAAAARFAASGRPGPSVRSRS
jgi:uncharacterized protein (DUF697 family)